MDKKISLTIGIPVYNEELNINKILKALLKQNDREFNINEIIVVSDGSTDKTVEKVREIKNKKIKLISFNKRLGKPIRENQIFEKANTDIVIIVDADIEFSSNEVIGYLIRPMKFNEKVMLTSGKALPFKPINLTQKIFYMGALIWEDSRNSIAENNLHLCEGEIRAFKKELYKELRFPNISAEDVYPFLYCATKKYNFISVKEAVVFYRLPRTLKDYFKQSTRYWKSKFVHEKNYNKNLVNKYYLIDWKVKLLFTIKRFCRNPFWTTLYILLIFFMKVFAFFSYEDSTVAVWSVSSSTKY